MKRRAHPADAKRLPRPAAQRAGQKNKKTSATAVPLAEARLLDELGIHKAELELQNEELRAARMELMVGLDRYTKLFDFAPIGYATLGPDGTVREINHAGASLLGQARAKVLGERFALFVKPPDRNTFTSLLAAVLNDDAAKSTCFLGIIAVRGDGPCVRVTADALFDGRTILLAFEDVTAQRRTDAALRRADEALRDADRRKDEFLAMLSHELRTPLSVLLMHGQLLQRKDLDPAAVRRSGEVIERATKAQARLIEDLLDVSRIIAGKLGMKHDAVSMAAAVHAAVESVTNDARKKNVRLEVTIAPHVCAVWGDVMRLQQAIWNLLTNAIKFTPANGRVEVTLDEAYGQARVVVQDTGAGIDRRLLPRLFERFFQADRTATRSRGGLGLGLSIAHAIVEAHGGALRAESAGRGNGSTFTLTVPLMDIDSTRAPEAAAAGAGRSEHIRGARLLVVEDDAPTRAALTHVLESAGAEVRQADNGIDAVQILARFRPHLLLCDIAMPGEDGCTLLRRIRALDVEHGGNVRALALTAMASEEDRARTHAAGFAHHLAKPVDIERLLATISDLLPSRKNSTRPTAH